MRMRISLCVPIRYWIGIALSVLSFPGFTMGQTDPGVRAGPPGAGGPIAGLDVKQGKFFSDGQIRFSEIEAVANGLGPRFNLDSCAGCHAAPAVGGSSPSTN